MKLDLLAFGAHPDDVELGCSGTLLLHIALGKKIGIIDLTQGELGTRGNAELRLTEASISASIIGAEVRENLNFNDGFFLNDRPHQIEVIKKIRKYKPEIVLANAISDRHPDHGKGSELVSDACFLAGLTKIETADENGLKQEAWRPKAVYHYIQYYDLKPDFLVDISSFIEKKVVAIKAFSSQFYDPNSKEPATLISQPEFLDQVYHRAENLGRIIGVKYAEGFTAERYVGVKDLFTLL